MQGTFDNDLVRNNFIIQFYNFGVDIDNFTRPCRQLDIADYINLCRAIANNMLYLDAFFVLGNWLHDVPLLPPKRFVALSV